MRIPACLAILLFLAAPPSAPQSATDFAVKSKIIALEHLVRQQAYESKDLKTLDAIFDSDFHDVSLDGKLQTKAEVLAFVENADSLHCLMDAVMVYPHNQTAIVTGLFQTKGILRGRPFLWRGRFVDTWIFKNGQWVAIASLATPAPSTDSRTDSRSGTTP